MGFFGDNWGSIASVLGVIVSAIGLWWAVQRAGQARDSAKAAEAAVLQSLVVTDLERAIALIQRIKLLHRDGKWEASQEHYAPLRRMLTDISERHSSLGPDDSAVLREAITQITVIDIDVNESLRASREPSEISRADRVLSEAQEKLEVVASSSVRDS